MITDREAFMRVAHLAHEKGVTIEKYLSKLEAKAVKKHNKLARNDAGDVVFSNGDIGIPITPTEEEAYILFRAAELKGIPLNRFVKQAAKEKMKELGIA